MKKFTGCFIILAIAAVVFVCGFLLAMRNYGDRIERRIEITNMSTSAQPWIGRVVKLRVKVKALYNEQFVEIKIVLPAGVKLVAGDPVWRGELEAKKSMTYEVLVCVLSEGDWRVEAQAQTFSSEDYSKAYYYNHEVIRFNSTKISPDGFCP